MAKTGTVSVLLSLKDKFSEPIKKTTKETKDFERRLKSTKNTINNWRKSAVSAFDRVALKAGKMALALTGISTVLSIANIKQFASSAIEAASAKEEVLTSLESALANVDTIANKGTSAIQSAKKELVDYADKLQTLGVVAGDTVVAGMSNLATYGLDTQQILSLSDAMTDLIAKTAGYESTASDAETIATALGKALSTGSYTALKKYGVVIDDVTTKTLNAMDATQRAAELGRIIEGAVGGTNANLGNTDQGRIVMAKNNWDDAMAEIGQPMLKIKSQFAGIANELIPSIKDALLDLVNSFLPYAERLLKWTQQNKQQIKDWIASAVSGIKSFASTANGIFSKIAKHGDTIGRVLLSIAGTMAVLSAGSKIFSAVKKLKDGFDKIKDVISVIRIAGLGPVAIAIAAIVAIVALLIANWDKVREKCIAIWKNIKENHQPLYNAILKIIELWKKQFSVVVTVVSQLASGLCVVAGWLVDHIEPAVNAIATLFDSMLIVIETTIGAVKDLVDWISKALDKLDLLNADNNNSIVFNAGETGNYKDALGFATGTTYFGGGLAEVGEHGGEILDLPTGTRIYPHDISKQMVSNNSNITVNVNIAGNVIGNRQYAEYIGDYLTNRVQLAIASR